MDSLLNILAVNCFDSLGGDALVPVLSLQDTVGVDMSVRGDYGNGEWRSGLWSLYPAIRHTINLGAVYECKI